MPKSLPDVFQAGMLLCGGVFILALLGAFGDDGARAAIGWSLFGGLFFLICFAFTSDADDAHGGEVKRDRDNVKPLGGSISEVAAQMVLASGDSPLPTPESLLLGDGMLQDWRTEHIVWREIWETASARRRHIPAYGEGPYWVPEAPGGDPFPLSQLAFYGAADRLRLAEHRDAPELLRLLLAEDRNAMVANAAKRTFGN